MSLGGQRRTIEVTCGWRCVGHPTEVNKKFLRHQRYCNECRYDTSEIPKFDTKSSLKNGWNGIAGFNKINKMSSIAYVNGERQDILVNGVNNPENSTKSIITSLSLLSLEETQETPPVLTKSQKKRLMKKHKKTKEEEYHIINISAEEQEENDKTANMYADL
jgi:hypothetical protein